MKIAAGIGVVLIAVGTTLILQTTKKHTLSQTTISEIIPRGELVIPAQFDSVYDFSGGMSGYSTKPSDSPLFTNHGVPGAPLTLDLSLGATGFVTQTGKIYPPIFWTVGYFNDGYAPAAVGAEKWGMINKDSSWVIQPTYIELGYYTEGLIPFRTKNLKWGFINLQNKVMIPASWDSVNSFSQGRAQVCNGTEFKKDTLLQKCGFIDTAGKIVVPLIYDNVEDFADDHALACKGINEKQKCGYLNLDGSVFLSLTIGDHQDSVTGDSLPSLSSFNNGVALYGGRYFDGIEKWGLLDIHLKKTIPLILNQELAVPGSSNPSSSFPSDPWPFDTDIQWEVVGATKTDPGRSAAIDRQGNIKFFSTYEQVTPFSQGLSAVKIGNKWGFINEKNVLVIPAQYQSVHAYSEGLAAVEINNKWGFIN